MSEDANGRKALAAQTSGLGPAVARASAAVAALVKQVDAGRAAAAEVPAGAEAIGVGLSIVMKHYLLQQFKLRPTETLQYPEERRETYPRSRWRHVLTRFDNGLEKCIGCSLCAGACPARCIYVEAAENTDDNRVSPGERYAARYEINMIRCIFCGYCQDACPTGAIVLRKDFELADYGREDFLYTKEMLLEPARIGAGFGTQESAPAS